MKIKQITNYLEEIAPLAFQESYDNSGLIVGDEDANVNSALVTIDCTEAVIDEAIEKNSNLIITHHPIIFSGIKKLIGKSYIERIIIKAIKNDIAIYAIHTNLDNVAHGVSAKIAEKLSLKNCKVLAPKKGFLRKLTVYCPSSDMHTLRNVLFQSGAGNIANYDECSFTSIGEGTFRANQGCNPHLGEIGKRHVEKEEKLEVIFTKHQQESILSAMYSAHPYEEVAYQIHVLENSHQNIGSGIVGDLSEAIDVESFLSMIKINLKTDCIRHTKLINKKIQKVAVCGGSGSFLLPNALIAKADIFITADFKYHEFFDTEDKIIIADIGHYESEQFTKELVCDFLNKKFTKFAVRLSKVNTNPINYL